uniref:Uncharacterized protein n=1 Tax=Entomoneis paludosa TaxID=265537 RepID=A0A7S3DV24_9STRA
MVHVLQPNCFFTRWYPDVVKHKEVVITKGHFGAVHILCETIVMEAMDQECPNTITLSSCPSADQDKSGIFRAVHEYSHVQHVAKAPKGAEMSPKSTQQFMKVSATYRLTLMGISKDLDANAEVMDPTGAGDSFLAGYLASLHDSLEDTLFSWDADKLQNQDSKTKSRLQFAAWVAGRKLGGVGARTALPTRQDVIDRLGHNPLHIQENVSRLVGNFDLDAISQKPQIL